MFYDNEINYLPEISETPNLILAVRCNVAPTYLVPFKLTWSDNNENRNTLTSTK